MIRGTRRKMPTTPAKRFNMGTSIHNRFDIEIVDKISGKVKQRAKAENVICSGLWTRLLAGNTYNTGVHYGGGSGTPAISDASLFSFIGYVASSIYDIKYDYDNNVYAVTKKAVLAETVAIGQTITEVGIAYSSSETSLVTHAMLKDMNGNPVSLEKTGTDIFNIYATVFVHLSMPAGVRCLGTIWGGSLAAEEVFYGPSAYYGGYLAHIAGLTNAISRPRALVAGGCCMYDSVLTPSITRDATNRSMTVSVPRLGASSFNSLRGIRTIFLGTQPVSNYSIETLDFAFEIDDASAWYPKTEIQEESIGTGDGATKDFSTKFNFAKNIIVRVDGVQVDATVDFGCARNIGHYLRLLRLPASCSYQYSGNQYPSLPMYTKGDSAIYVRSIKSDDPSHKPVYENILCETHGIASISGQYKYIAVSDDLVDWVILANGVNGTTTIPEQYQHYRYWRLHNTYIANDGYEWTFNPTTPVPTSVNIHLAEAPPEGAVITADYDAICIGKDENHVFDFSVTFQFNEYTEAQ